jgi:hypothetical protein
MSWLSRVLEDWFDDVFLSAIVLILISLVVLIAASISIPVWLIAEALDTYGDGELWGTLAAVACVVLFGPRLIRVSFPSVIEVFEQKAIERERRANRSQQARSR